MSAGKHNHTSSKFCPGRQIRTVRQGHPCRQSVNVGLVRSDKGNLVLSGCGACKGVDCVDTRKSSHQSQPRAKQTAVRILTAVQILTSAGASAKAQRTAPGRRHCALRACDYMTKRFRDSASMPHIDRSIWTPWNGLWAGCPVKCGLIKTEIQKIQLSDPALQVTVAAIF